MSVLTRHQKAALSFDHHISLTANAGSGKTFVLSIRYLEIALSQKSPNLRNIAAISFTDKAASELYKKIAVEIDKRIAESSDNKIIWKLENIRRQLVSANISTIHSFCINILREFPVEAGLDANFTPIDELLSGELIELSVDELIKNSFNKSEEEEKLKYLVRILGSKTILTNELIQLIKNRKNVLVIAEEIYSRNAEEIGEFLFDSFKNSFDEIFKPKITSFLETVRMVNNEVIIEKPGNKTAVEIENQITRFNIENDITKIINDLQKLSELVFTKSGTVKVQGYLSKIISESLSEKIEFLNEFNALFKNIELAEDHSLVELELAKFGKTIIHFFNVALGIYNHKKKENGYLDYEDILLFTKKILENDIVRQSLSKKYSYIMVDEYQDTNELQYNIFLPILDYLNKGNLFVVGDEKQSIYMFRDAELEVFNRTKNDIDKTDGDNKLLTLPESFRMSPAIALFTNKLFSNLFKHPDQLFNEVKYNELICASNTETEGHIEVLLAEETEDDSENNSELNNEAELVSARISNLISSEDSKNKVNFNDIAVLCRKRNEFREIENAFVKNKIPFVVVGGKGFYQRQSIYDIYNYFSFLLDKEDDTALIGTLRSPFFNLSDSEIFEISLIDGKSYLEKLQKYAQDKASIKNVLDILTENLKLSFSYDLTALFRKILNETNYLAVISSRSNYLQELANIEKLGKVITSFYSFGFKTLYDLVSFLKDSIGRIEDESQAIVSDESNSVRIMTYHQAKGLEFKAVFLYKSHQAIKRNTIKAKSLSINKRFGILTKVPLDFNISGSYKKAPILGIADLIERKKISAEYKRLFYVGVTRAIEYLFISGSSNKDNNYDSDSIFGMLQNSLGIDFNNDIDIKSKLKFTSLVNDKYETVEKNVDTSIKIIKQVEKQLLKQPEKEINADLSFLLNKITDKPEGEFISATKVAVYKQCPLKYQLTYEYGFTKLFNNYKKWLRKSGESNNQLENYNFNEREDLLHYEISEAKENTKGFSDVKGRIIHKVLQEEIPENELDDFIKNRLKDEIGVFDSNKESSESIKNEIIDYLQKYFKSETFKYLSSFSNYKNEFEIYLKENDYFLYGIIDKLIITEEKIFIIDYKTDDIDKENIEERGRSYLPQLEFYSYIVNHFLNKNLEIELKIVFLKYPDEKFSKIIGQGDIKRIKFELKSIIVSVRNEEFPTNKDHCSKCLYALNQDQCIIK